MLFCVAQESVTNEVEYEVTIETPAETPIVPNEMRKTATRCIKSPVRYSASFETEKKVVNK